MKRTYLLFMLSLIVSIAMGQESSPKSVALLPTVITSGEKWDKLRTGLIQRVDNGLKKQFTSRGFTITDQKKISEVLAEAKVDLNDEENFKRETFFSLGDRLGVDFVVFFVITNNQQRMRQNAFVNVPEGEVTIKYWILEVAQRKAIASAKTQTSKARPGTLAAFAKGSDQQLTAADRAVVEALKEFLKDYPVIDK